MFLFNTNNDMILCPQNPCLEAFNIFCRDIEIKGKNLRSNIKIWNVCLDNIGQVREGLVHRTPKTYDYEEDDDRPKRSSFICQRREINKYYIPVNWLNVLFKRDWNLKCDPAKNTLKRHFYIEQKIRKKKHK